MTDRTIRIPPLPQDQWGELEKQAFETFMAPGAKSVSGNPDNKNKDTTVLDVLMNHPKLAKGVLPLSSFLLREGELSARDRELLVLRVGWRRQSAYEWTQHVALSLMLEIISEEEIRRVKHGAKAPEWSELDRLLMSAVDELLDAAFLTQPTWDGLSKYYSKHQMMEVVYVVGAYTTMAMAFNSFGVPISNENLQATFKEFPFSD